MTATTDNNRNDDTLVSPGETPPPTKRPGTGTMSDPLQIDNVDEAPPKKRGRPAGSTTTKHKTAAKNDNETLAKNIAGIHAMAAMMTGIPEVQLSEDEAQMLASAVDGLSREYGLKLDGKTGAAIQLIGAAAIIYGPRAIAISARLSAAKKASEAAQNEKTDG